MGLCHELFLAVAFILLPYVPYAEAAAAGWSKLLTLE